MMRVFPDRSAGFRFRRGSRRWSRPVLAQSQATTGVIEGTVLDQREAPLPGAAVAIRNTDTNFEKASNTGADGRFRGVLLPLGPLQGDREPAGLLDARA